MDFSPNLPWPSSMSVSVRDGRSESPQDSVGKLMCLCLFGSFRINIGLSLDLTMSWIQQGSLIKIPPG